MTCVIAAPTVDAIHQHVTAEYPREGCGLLVGRDRADERLVEYAVPVPNGDAHATRRYSISPEDFLMAEKEARQRGLEIVGFYHSHPDVEPSPSPSDAAEAWPHYTYLIIGVRSGQMGPLAAWRFDQKRAVAETVRVSGANGASR